MAYETSNGKVRVTTPRASDNANHANGANAVDRSRDHRPDGTFAKGNRAAANTGARRAVRVLVPARARRFFDDACKQLGAEGGTIVFLHCADAARHHLDAADLSELARGKGLDSAAGAELHSRAQRSSELALRAMTAALDCARLLKHPRAKVAKTKTPVGFEDE